MLSRGETSLPKTVIKEVCIFQVRLLPRATAVGTRGGRRNREAPWWVCRQCCGKCPFSTPTNFYIFQNPKRRVPLSNSSVSSVAGWTLPTSSSVPSASVPWLVQKGEWSQPHCCAQGLPFPQDCAFVSCSCVPPPFSNSPPQEAVGVVYLTSYFLTILETASYR